MGILTKFVFLVVAVASFIALFVTTMQLVERLSTQFPSGVPRTDDYKNDDFWYPLFVDFSLLLLFVCQHSFLATAWWKDKMYSWGLQPIERSIYVLTTAAALHWVMNKWLPLPCTPLWFFDTWSGERPFSYLFFFLVHLVMWIVIYGTSLTMDFAELVGLKQVYYYSQGLDEPMSFKSTSTQRLYHHMRHPGALCFCIVLWLHPVMTLGRFMLALNWTLYLLFGRTVRERDYIYMETQVQKKRITVAEGSWELLQ